MLLRASSEAKDDVEWLAQVQKNGGIIVSVDGIQPEKGNETVYVVRDALTGRVLAAENVTSSETAVMKARLSPVVALEVKVLGTITDAPSERTEGGGGVVARGPAPGVPVPRLARCGPTSLRGGEVGEDRHAQSLAAQGPRAAQAAQARHSSGVG